MATAFKTPTRSFFSFATMVATLDGVKQALGAAWSVLRNRRAVGNLHDLDDYLLADIGLTRADLQAAAALPLSVDPSLRLAAVAHQSDRAPPYGRPQGQRGDAAAPPTLWRAS